jgi:hypothetical protein
MAEQEGTIFYLGNELIEVAILGEDKVAFTPFIPDLQVDFLLVGGGGAGAWPGTRNGGGGGAGRFLSGSLPIEAGRNVTITIGAGGIAPASSLQSPNGDATTANIGLSGVTWSAPGGGGGGRTNENGRNGGSGGGAGGTTLNAHNGGTAQNGSPINGFGNNGFTNASDATIGGGGGGAGSTSAGLGAGGSGFAWVDGVSYARGGTGGQTPVTPITPAGAGSGGSGGYFQSGVGSFKGSDGRNGVVVIRYSGNRIKASGGTITQVGGFVYHTFTSNGTFTY